MRICEAAFIAMGVLVFGAGCALMTQEEDVSGDPPISGEVERDGEVVEITLYQHHADSFGSTQSASGFIDTEDGTLLAHVELEFENLSNAIQDEAEEIEVGHLGSGIGHPQEYGVGITWYETRPDEDEDVEVFVQGYRDGGDATAEGTLFVDDTDWQEYLIGRLEAQLAHPDDGTRVLELEWHWGTP